MKYDKLCAFREYVFTQCKSKNTARNYYSSVKKLLEEQQFSSFSEIDGEFIERKLLEVRTKNKFSSVKRGLELLKEFDPTFPIPDEVFFRTESRHRRNHRKKTDSIEVDKTKRKINQIRNKKLKLAYRLGLISGLRVSELADLEASDIAFNENDEIVLHVRHGKGDKEGTVICRKDDYVSRELKSFIEGKEGKLFYSAQYMIDKAGELGMECHDLRRLYAHEHKKELRKAGKTNYEANKVVQSNLRHARYKTTKRYLYGKKFV